MATEIVLTALPNGIVDGELLASLHVAPRLTAVGGIDTLLEDYPLFTDWPSTLSQLDATAIEVTVDGVPMNVAIDSVADSPTWRATFPAATTGVFSHTVPDFSTAPIHSFPAAAVQSFLATEYGKYGVSGPESFPLAQDLLDPSSLGPVDFSGRDGALRRAQLLGQLADARASNGFVASTAASVDVAHEFIQVLDFHTPPTTTRLPRIPLIELDFHRAVTFVQSYPTLLRLLGLVIDVRLTPPRGGAVPSGIVGVQADISWGRVVPPAMTRPITGALHDPVGGVFRTEGRPGTTFDDLRVVDGFLPFDDGDRYQVVQVDTDGAVEKLTGLAGGMANAVGSGRSVDTPDRYALPSLQTAGVAVARIGMAGQLRRSTERSQQFHAISTSGGAPGIWAEDVTRGIWVDVYDVEAGRWYPLCERDGTITLPGISTIAERVPGVVSIAPTSAVDDSVPDLYQPETLFTWAGWSLVVARPGAQIANRPNEAGETIPGEVPESNPAVARTPLAPHPDIDLTQEFRVPAGTLPRLRFGARYRLRARVCDLAGNGEPFGDPTSTDFSRATQEFVYRRFEPVQSPPVLLRDETVPAERVERIVIRTDNDGAVFDTPSSERHAVPPKQSQTMAEQLGRFDTGPGGAVDASRYAEIAAADAVRLDAGSGGVQAGDFPDTFRFPAAMIDIGYLPDPLARGVTLRYVDGPNAGQSVQIPFDDATNGWPVLRGMRLRAVKGAGLASLVVDDSTERVVDVPLEPAAIVHARISCTSSEGDLSLFAVWQWILDRANQLGINITNLRAAAREGRHWMLTPHRTLTFVHAVKRPLAVPLWAQPFSVSRQLGATDARIGRLLTFDRPSTQEVSVVGAWQEPVDLGPGRGVPDTVSPFSIQTEATAFTERFEYGPATPTTDYSGRHEFNDTKRRDIDYRLVAVSRFPEHFTVSTQVTVPPVTTPTLTPVVLDAAGVAAGTVVARLGDDTLPARAYSVDPANGTITFGDAASGPAPAPGETVDVSYVPGSITEVGVPERRIVPSSARPAAPSIEYVIPTFGWASTGGAARISARRGGGLRVYLQRPWWSSGEGELLGVVTLPAAEPGASVPFEVPNQLAPYVTQWGLDPVYASANLPHPHPRLGDFTAAVTTDTGLLLAETDAQVNVAGHQVGFDAERDLWYADITVAAGTAYQPMIRLALARYQPESINGVHLSSIALAEFAQLAASRYAVMIGGGSRARQLFVFGPSYGATEARPGPGVVEASVEVRDSSWGDETVGWRPVGRSSRLGAVGGSGFAMWSGTLRVPTDGRKYRVVITQYEEFRTDDGPPGARGAPIGRRPVYTDILPLSGGR